MTQTRTDVHRPSATEFDPEAYIYMGSWDLFPEWPAPEMAAHRLAVVNKLIDAGYRVGANGFGQCGHCGTRIRYAALMARPDVREYIYVGETCLDERFSLAAGEFQALRKAAALNRERMTKRDRIAALVDEHPLLAWLTYPDAIENTFVADIAYKLRRDGELSERQIEAVESAIVRDTERAVAKAAREAAKAALVEAGVQAPEGRLVVEGEIVSVKEHETEDHFGNPITTWKMTVRTDAGWLAWSTLPAAIYDAVRWDAGLPSLVGQRVTFTATLTRSDDDPLFAFAKRPTKAALLSKETAA
jgi:hypothetical protein